MRIIYLISLIFFFSQAIIIDAQSSVEAQIDNAVADSRIRDMVLLIGNSEGIQYTSTKGDFALDTAVPIASASKWYTAATIMALVDEGIMSLEDSPSDYFDWWTSDPDDARSSVTVSMLLSFTSGFNSDAPDIGCLRLIARRTTNEDCTRTIYDNGLESEPGEAFSYGGAHMHIVATMAETATGQTFNAIFRERIAEPLGMSDATVLEFATEDNPQPAGGFVSTANDYALFLQMLLHREFFSAEVFETLFTDHTSDVTFLNLPRAIERRNDWHYSYGSWMECDLSIWSTACDDSQIFSSGGAFGWFPWIDFENNSFGIVAQEGNALTSPVGRSVDLASEIRPLIPALLDS